MCGSKQRTLGIHAQGKRKETRIENGGIDAKLRRVMCDG